MYTSQPIDYSRLPIHIRGGAKRYLELGIKPGDFLTAVFKNKFLEAFARADDTNIACMKDIANFMYNEVPATCRGEKNMKRWMEAHAIVRVLCTMIMGWDGYREANKKAIG